MTYTRQKILDYWNDSCTQSMYDKHLLKTEISMIKQHLSPGSTVLDAGCGEGEGTAEYASIPGITIRAVDFSPTRLTLAAARLRGLTNVTPCRLDLLQQCEFRNEFDAVISQRFLINITEWRLQQRVLENLMRALKAGGRLILLEGYSQGTNELNSFRHIFDLPPIPVKWHNLFLDDGLLIEFMSTHGGRLVHQSGAGAYFLLTRGIRPAIDKGKLAWDCAFNRLSASRNADDLLALGARFSRLKLWVFTKDG